MYNVQMFHKVKGWNKWQFQVGKKKRLRCCWLRNINNAARKVWGNRVLAMVTGLQTKHDSDVEMQFFMLEK